MSLISGHTLRLLLRQALLLAGLGLLFLIGTVTSEDFLTVDNQRDVLDYVAINGTLAVGMTLVILTAGIDLSVGSILSLCTIICAMLVMPADYELDGVGGWLAPLHLTRAHLFVLPAVGLFGGMLVGRVVGRLVRRRPASWAWAWGAGLAAAGGLTWGVWAYLQGMTEIGVATTAALILTPLVGALLGMCSGVIIAGTRLQPFIVTLAMMIFAVGLARYIAGDGGRIHTVYTAAEGLPGAQPSFEALGTTKLLKVGEMERRGRTYDLKLIPVQAVFMLGAWVVMFFALRKLPLGRHIYAVGGNEEAARLSGVNTAGVKIFVYSVSGLLAGLAGVLYTAKYTQGKATAGEMMELDAIAAVVIGGTSLMGGRGGLFGTLVGVMIFGYLTNILQLKSVSSEFQQMLKGGIIIAAATIQSGIAVEWLRRVRTALLPQAWRAPRA